MIELSRHFASFKKNFTQEWFMRQPAKRLSKLKRIGLVFLIGAGMNVAFATLDMKPTVEEYDKHESGIARLILGGGGVWSLARTFHAGGFAPLGIYGGAAIGYYLIHKARPEWFPL